MTKYCKLLSLLDDIKCFFTKIDIVLLLTLAFNEEIIIRIIDVLQIIAN